MAEWESEASARRPSANALVEQALGDVQTWDVITLLDGVVLLVNSSGRPATRRIADEIYRYYGGATRAI